MRLHPTVTQEEAEQWLTAQARAVSPSVDDAELLEIVREFAKAMAAVSAVALPPDDPTRMPR
jgi:hypothetical protein